MLLICFRAVTLPQWHWAGWEHNSTWVKLGSRLYLNGWLWKKKKLAVKLPFPSSLWEIWYCLEGKALTRLLPSGSCSKPGVGRPGSLSLMSCVNSIEELLFASVRFWLGFIQLDRVPRPCWIQCIALLVSAEVKNRDCSVQAPDPSAGPWLSGHTWCLLCFCEELLTSIEKH